MQQYIINPAPDTAAFWGRDRDQKKGETQRYHIYLFKLVYELKFLKATSCIKTEVQFKSRLGISQGTFRFKKIHKNCYFRL